MDNRNSGKKLKYKKDIMKAFRVIIGALCFRCQATANTLINLKDI